MSIGIQSSTFYLADEELKVHAPGTLVKATLKTCDGKKTIDEVIEILGARWQSGDLRKFLHELRRIGILYDGRSIGDYAWSFVKNPTRLTRDLSDKEVSGLVRSAYRRGHSPSDDFSLKAQRSYLSGLLQRRHSVRSFSTRTVSVQKITQMLWAGYGISDTPLELGNGECVDRHTVPSAGALYPLQFSLVILKPTAGLNVGIYRLTFKKSNMIGFTLVESDTSSVVSSFANPLTLQNAQGVVVISGSFQISSEKYGNRSMLYVPVEVGHAAQNIHLAGVENNLGTLEVGGFLEQPLRQAIGLSTEYWPMTTIVFGYPSINKSSLSASPSSHEISWAAQAARGYKLPFFMAFAKVRDDGDSACGRSKNPVTAMLKASAEAEEWAACGRIARNLVKASFCELSNAIDPRKIVRYHPRQYERVGCPLKPFGEKRDYYWVGGRGEIGGDKVCVLSDCVYFPYAPSTPRYTYANSSGTAANPQWDQAVKNAALELIERDAFMIVWLNRLRMPHIHTESLSGVIQKRIRALRRAGFRVAIKDFTLDLAPVMFVFAQSETLPMTTCAACSAFDTEEALDHALMEVEASAYCRLNAAPSNPIQPKKVRFTDDHGNLYGQHRFFRRADFLANGGSSSLFSGVGKSAPKTWTDLLDQLATLNRGLITVRLLGTEVPSTKRAMNIAKVFIPGLIPMSFGYGLEPCGMERIFTLPVALGYRRKPMVYGELTKFPHPYT